MDDRTHGKSTTNYTSRDRDRVGGLGRNEGSTIRVKKWILQDGFVMRTVLLNGGTPARHHAFWDVRGQRRRERIPICPLTILWTRYRTISRGLIL